MIKVKYLTREDFIEIFRTHPTISWQVIVGRLDSEPNLVFPILKAGPRQDSQVLCTVVIDLKGNTATFPIPGKMYDSLPETPRPVTLKDFPMKKEIL